MLSIPTAGFVSDIRQRAEIQGDIPVDNEGALFGKLVEKLGTSSIIVGGISYGMITFAVFSVVHYFLALAKKSEKEKLDMVKEEMSFFSMLVYSDVVKQRNSLDNTLEFSKTFSPHLI